MGTPKFFTENPVKNRWYKARIFSYADRVPVKVFMSILYSRDVKLIQCCGPHLHTWISYGPNFVKKNLSWQDCISVVPKLFVCRPKKPVDQIFAEHQPRHYLEITIFPGNDLRNSCNVAQNDVEPPPPKKKDHYR